MKKKIIATILAHCGIFHFLLGNVFDTTWYFGEYHKFLRALNQVELKRESKKTPKRPTRGGERRGRRLSEDAGGMRSEEEEEEGVKVCREEEE